MSTYIKKMTGYKATDSNLKCRDHQFVLGEWSPVIEGDLQLCAKGWHFCVQPSGVWSYYNSPTTRVFKCEAEDVLEVPTEAGADFKLVARRIRLVEEITPGKVGNDKSNTGNSNTGYRNTGNSNTGYSNAANYSAGFFCVKEPKVMSFDKQTRLTREQFTAKYPEYYSLGELLLKVDTIDFAQFKRIPGITPAKLKALHRKHLLARKLIK
jgi:hypothetical protein